MAAAKAFPHEVIFKAIDVWSKYGQTSQRAFLEKLPEQLKTEIPTRALAAFKQFRDGEEMINHVKYMMQLMFLIMWYQTNRHEHEITNLNTIVNSFEAWMGNSVGGEPITTDREFKKYFKMLVLLDGDDESLPPPPPPPQPQRKKNSGVLSQEYDEYYIRSRHPLADPKRKRHCDMVDNARQDPTNPRYRFKCSDRSKRHHVLYKHSYKRDLGSGRRVQTRRRHPDQIVNDDD